MASANAWSAISELTSPSGPSIAMTWSKAVSPVSAEGLAAVGNGALLETGSEVIGPVVDGVATGAVEHAINITRTATSGGHGRRLDRFIGVSP